MQKHVGFPWRTFPILSNIPYRGASFALFPLLGGGVVSPSCLLTCLSSGTTSLLGAG